MTRVKYTKAPDTGGIEIYGRLNERVEKVMLIITGVTHVPCAPIWEFFSLAYLPELSRIGARVEAEMEETQRRRQISIFMEAALKS